MTVLAWGNCLGDMSADVAMTKKGFGEMAITATMAGPIFNIMVGGFLTNFCYILKHPGETIDFSAFKPDGSLADDGKLPLFMLSGQIVCLFILLVNALLSGFNLNYKTAILNIIFYAAILTYIIYFTIADNVNIV